MPCTLEWSHHTSESAAAVRMNFPDKIGLCACVCISSHRLGVLCYTPSGCADPTAVCDTLVATAAASAGKSSRLRKRLCLSKTASCSALRLEHRYTDPLTTAISQPSQVMLHTACNSHQPAGTRNRYRSNHTKMVAAQEPDVTQLTALDSLWSTGKSFATIMLLELARRNGPCAWNTQA